MQSIVLYAGPNDSRRQPLEAALGISFRVLVAHSGKEALSLADMHSPDVVIFGSELPDVSPIEACRGLRGTGRRLPVVLALGRVLDSDWQLTALHAGVNAFLQADAAPDLIARQVESLLAVGRDRRAILDAFSEGYYALDAQWRFIEFNAAAEEHFGRRASDMTGKDFWRESGVPRDSVIGENFRAAASGSTTMRFETESQLRAGRWYEVHLHPRNGGGLNVYYRDITGRKRAEEAVRLSEEKFARAFHGSMAAMTITCVEDGRYLEVNDRWLEATGFRREDVIGRTTADINFWKRSEDRESFVAELRQHGFVMNAECEFRRASGEEWIALVSAQTTEIGNEPVVISSVLDITARKHAETALRESEARLRRLYDSGMIGVLYFTVDGEVTDANDKFLSTVGYTREDLRAGRIRWEQMTPFEYRRLDEHALDELRATGVDTPYEKEFIRKDGSRVPIVVGAAVFDDARHRGIAFVLDITDRQRAEQALREANLRLAEADRRKDEFIAILSHELRNPLAPIQYAIPLLRAQQIDDAGQRALAVVDRQVHHLTRLVDDLLDVSRITRGKIELRRERVTLHSVLTAAYEAASPAIAAARHTLELRVPEEPIWLHVDAARITQVVTNLLNNSAKYTPRGGEILLQGAQDDGRAVIRVRDNGVGIPAEALTSVFDMFEQVNRPDRSQGGLGIGLALARLLVDMHGGSIQAHSAGAGQGAEFVVTLPVARPSQRAASAQEKPALTADSRHLRVLVVDDNADLVDMLALTVEAAGHEVRRALDGRSALAAAAAFRPDVVLLDLGLPLMTGLDVARELRRRPEFARLRLVALTGWGQAEDRRRTREAGFDRHLTKPTEPHAVTRLLAEFASEL